MHTVATSVRDPLLQHAALAGGVSPEAMERTASLLAVQQRSSLTVNRLLYGLCSSLKVQFLLEGQEVAPADVLSPSALLPGVAWMVQDAGKRLLDADFGCELKVAQSGEATLLGVRCVVPPMTGHIADVIRSIFFIHYTTEFFGIREGAMVEVAPAQQMLRGVFESHLEAQASVEGIVSWPQVSRTH